PVFQGQEIHEKVKIATCGIESASRRRAEDLQGLDTMLAAQAFQFAPVLLDEVDHYPLHIPILAGFRPGQQRRSLGRRNVTPSPAPSCSADSAPRSAPLP